MPSESTAGETAAAAQTNLYYVHIWLGPLVVYSPFAFLTLRMALTPELIIRADGKVDFFIDAAGNTRLFPLASFGLEMAVGVSLNFTPVLRSFPGLPPLGKRLAESSPFGV